MILLTPELIRANPKIFCGYFDITALQGAILARAGLVTYCGPHWSSFGMARHFDQTLHWFTACLLGDDPVRLEPASTWTDDLWSLDQDNREVLPTDGWWPLQQGRTTGRLVGGNLATLNLLQGTPYMPSLAGAVLTVEDDDESQLANFAPNLTSPLQLPDAATIRGLVVGRFQRASNMTRPLLEQIIARQPRLAGLPILANVGLEVSLWEQVLSPQNLGRALRRVGANRGAPGVDGMATGELRPWLHEHWAQVWKALDAGTYQPSPVRRVVIPKPGGGERLLGVPTVTAYCAVALYAVTVGMPSGRSFAFAFGTYTRLAGRGFQVWMLWYTRTASAILAGSSARFPRRSPPSCGRCCAA